MRVYIINADDLITARKGPIEPQENKIDRCLDRKTARCPPQRQTAARVMEWFRYREAHQIGDRAALTGRLWTAMETLPDQQPARTSKQNRFDPGWLHQLNQGPS